MNEFDMVTSFVLAATIFVSSLAAAALALMLFPRFANAYGQRHGLAESGEGPVEQAVFLFDDGELIDATRPARALLASLPGQSSEWKMLTEYLARHIDHFLGRMAELPHCGAVDLPGVIGSGIGVRAEKLGEFTRLTVNDTSREGTGILVDGLSLRAQESELEELRECLSQAPMLIWRTDAAGTIVWANGAYLFKVMERDQLREDDLTWPIPTLFTPTAPHEDAKRRLSIPAQPHMAELWYDCHSFASGEGTLYYAIPANAAVRAERSLQEFIQTLTKTFAHVPIGLAIFDRSRQLQLFNPALVDLTSLGFEFLSLRPSLPTFLDRLREARIIPEPKDYGLWRQQMAELERAAASGHHEETWALPSGQTYRVTGHPHTDGALVFLFEDISTETAMTRSFRTEIQLSQAVIDTVDEAIAVFSAAGDLIMSNAAYATLWDIDPAATLGTVRILDSVRHWVGRARPDPIWGEIRDFVSDIGERVDWSGDCTLADGRPLSCRILPLPGGATLIGFTPDAAMAPDLSEPAGRRLTEDLGVV
jgi:PAS domain-containing protein